MPALASPPASSPAQQTTREWTVAELAERFGSLPAWRVRTDVPPGAATEDDLDRLRREQGVLCELIDGVLVEKAVSTKTAILAGEILGRIWSWVSARRLGWVPGADGFVRLFGTRLRAPDVSFIRRAQWPEGPPETGYADGAPDLAVEVVSPGNTRAEMQEKREEYFAAGAQAVWIVWPEPQTIEVWTTPETVVAYSRGDILPGGAVLPGFELDVAALFDAVAPSDDQSQKAQP